MHTPRGRSGSRSPHFEEVVHCPHSSELVPDLELGPNKDGCPFPTRTSLQTMNIRYDSFQQTAHQNILVGETRNYAEKENKRLRCESSQPREGSVCPKTQSPLIMPILGDIFTDVAFNFSIVSSVPSSLFITLRHVLICLFHFPQAPNSPTPTSRGITGTTIIYLHLTIGMMTGGHPVFQR